MPSVFVLYPTPTDAAVFDQRYRDEHVLLVKEHLSMAKFRPHPVLGAVGGSPPFHLVVELEFASAEDMEAALASSGGQSTAGNAFAISSGGPPIMLIVK
ncbi:MAG: EthD family reductase [Gemmatimonadaceae bacterium]